MRQLTLFVFATILLFNVRAEAREPFGVPVLPCDVRDALVARDGSLSCPAPLNGFLPDFWRGSVLGEWKPPTAAEWTLVGITTTLVVLDVLQTSDCLYHRKNEIKWLIPNRSFIITAKCIETNPLLGEHPGRLRLWGESMGGTVLMIALWYILPPKWRNAHVAAEGGVELAQVVKAGMFDGLKFRF